MAKCHFRKKDGSRCGATLSLTSLFIELIELFRKPTINRVDALAFAQRARCAVAIFFRAATDIVRFFGGPDFAFCFAHRAL
jgi:hypothetical protein